MGALTKNYQTRSFANDVFGAMDDLFYYTDISNKILSTVVDTHEDGYEIRAEVPGLNRDDIDISFENNMLSITAKWEEKKGAYLRKGKYKKSYTAYDIDVSNITAELKDGILTVVVPKSENAKAKKIEIKS